MTDTSDNAFGFSADERLEYERTLLRLLAATLVEGYLEETGIQAQELASRMHKSKSWVSKLLSGTHNPTLDTLADVAYALGVRWDVSICAVDRAGTPAAADPPPPHWVAPRPGSTNNNVLTYIVPSAHENRSAVKATGGSALGWMTPTNEWQMVSPICTSAAFSDAVHVIRAGNQQ